MTPEYTNTDQCCWYKATANYDEMTSEYINGKVCMFLERRHKRSLCPRMKMKNELEAVLSRQKLKRNYSVSILWPDFDQNFPWQAFCVSTNENETMNWKQCSFVKTETKLSCQQFVQILTEISLRKYWNVLQFSWCEREKRKNTVVRSKLIFGSVIINPSTWRS